MRKILPISHAMPLRWLARIAISGTFSPAFKLGWETSSLNTSNRGSRGLVIGALLDGNSAAAFCINWSGKRRDDLILTATSPFARGNHHRYAGETD
jgi:hypothetical protein